MTMEEFCMHIVMYIGLGALFILVGYWVGVRRPPKAVTSDLGGFAGIPTTMRAQVLRVTVRSDRAIAVVQALIVSCNQDDHLCEPPRTTVLESEDEHIRRMLSEAGILHTPPFHPGSVLNA
jgi:hypothetical protein